MSVLVILATEVSPVLLDFLDFPVFVWLAQLVTDVSVSYILVSERVTTSTPTSIITSIIPFSFFVKPRKIMTTNST